MPSWLQLPTTCCWPTTQAATTLETRKTTATRRGAGGGGERGGNKVEATEEERQPINDEAVEAITEQPKSSSSERPSSFLEAAASQPRPYDLEAGRTFLCGAKSKIREDQVDLCPLLWFANLNPCRSVRDHDNNGEEEEEDDDSGSVVLHGGVTRCKLIQRWVWRICFITLCLPLCYPCYLSRTIRRRKKTSDYMYLDKELFVGQFKDKLNETMQRQVPLNRKKTAKNSDDDEEAAGAGDGGAQDNSKVINVNVIVIHSKSSQLLHRYLNSDNLGLPLKISGLANNRCQSAPADVVDSAGGGEVFFSLEDPPASKPQRSQSFGSSPSSTGGLRVGPLQRKSALPSQFASNLSAVPEESLNVSTSSSLRSGDVVDGIKEEEEEADGESSNNLIKPGSGGSNNVNVTVTVNVNGAYNSHVQAQDEAAVRLLPKSPTATMAAPPPVIEVSEEVDGIVVVKKPQHSVRRKSSVTARLSRITGFGSSGRKSSIATEGSAMYSNAGNSSSPGLLRRPSRKASISQKLSRQFSQEVNNASEYESAIPEDEPGVQYRKSRRRRSHIKRKSSRKLSIVSGSSIYYSFDSDPEDDECVNGINEAKSRTLEMIALGNRSELVNDLGYEVSFSMFDEASVADWRGRDLRQATSIPNIDLLLLSVRRGDVGEISGILDLHSGIMGYIAKFWRGFFPILIVEILPQSQEAESAIQDTEAVDEDYWRRLDRLRDLFGDIHLISVKEHEFSDNLDWLNECMARLFIHSRLYQCSRFFGADITSTMVHRCPGGCGLRKSRLKPKRINRQAARRRRSRLPMHRHSTMTTTVSSPTFTDRSSSTHPQVL